MRQPASRFLLLASVLLWAGLSASSALAARITNGCGEVVGSVTKSETDAFSAGGTYGFEQIPGALIGVNVPKGSLCVKVLFTASANCCPGSGQQLCYVRAMDGKTPLPPAVEGGLGFDEYHGHPRALAFEWVQTDRPGSSRHYGSGGSPVPPVSPRIWTFFHVQGWSMDVTVMK